ncbi:MAG: hypothetical protein KKE84_09135 [Gammaproteobacteria bacterium]|nr:hypothetical protein [Gammaproteobacteria bacterium]
MIQPRFSLNLTEGLPAGHTVADIFDAITAERPYRGPIPVADAIAMREKERGTAIDGACLDVLKQALPELGF